MGGRSTIQHAQDRSSGFEYRQQPPPRANGFSTFSSTYQSTRLSSDLDAAAQPQAAECQISENFLTRKNLAFPPSHQETWNSLQIFWSFLEFGSYTVKTATIAARNYQLTMKLRMNTPHNENFEKAAEGAKAISAAALNALSAAIATARAARDAIDAMHAAHAFLYESAAPDTPLHAVELKLHALLMKSNDAGKDVAKVVVLAQDCALAVEHRIEELRKADEKNSKGD